MEHTLIEVKLSTECCCEDYDETNDVSYPSDFCYGCYDDDKNEVDVLLLDWAQRNHHEGEFVKVAGSEMLWTRISLTRVIPLENLVDYLALNGDYNLYFKLDGKELTVLRTSHDEPTGASFIVTPAEEEDYV